MSQRALFYARFAVGIVAVSFGAILVRLAGEAPALAIAGWRLAFTAAVLAPLAPFRRSLWRIPRREALLSVASGAALAVHFILWITSLQYTTVASSVLFVTTHPIFVGLGARFLFKERWSRGLVLGMALALLGGGLIGFGDLGVGGDALRGDLLALGGGFAVAVYFLIGRHVRKTVSVIDYITITYGTAAVIVLLTCLIARCPLTGYTTSTYLFLALLALGPQLVGHSTFNWALKHLPASQVSAMILAEPIGSTLLALLFFGETPTWLNGIGAVIILLGIYWTQRIKEASDDRN